MKILPAGLTAVRGALDFAAAALLSGGLLSMSPLPAIAGPVDDLLPGQWYRVPNSQMRAVDPCPQRDCSYSGVEGQTSVMDSWSGGAYDSKRDRLIIWGGGHSAYGGNEVYVFDVNTLAWSRIINPTTGVNDLKTPYYPDGRPRIRHTYDYVEYLPPPVDRFCSFGSAGLYPAGGVGFANVDCLDLDTLTWERRADALSFGIGAISDYDSATGRLWMHGVESGGYLTEFDYQNNRWIPHGSFGIENRFLDYEMTAAIDPVRRKFLAVGFGNVYVWDLSSASTIRATPLTTTGGNAIVNATSPGLAYDPNIGKFVAWSGGSTVYTFDIVTNQWVAQTAVNPQEAPGAANSRGTYGRFRYIPSKRAYVVVNSVDGDVYFYKLPAGPLDTTAPAAPTGLQVR